MRDQAAATGSAGTAAGSAGSAGSTEATGATGSAKAANPIRRGLRWARWYMRELTDESAYDRYVEHLRTHDPEARVPSRREFERWRTDSREGDPRSGFRCC